MRQKKPRFFGLVGVLGLWVIFTIICPALRAQETPPSAQDDLAEILDLLPARFELLLVVPDMSQLSDRTAIYNDQLELNVMGLSNLLEEFKRSVGMNKGVSSEGAFLLAVENINSLFAHPTKEENAPRTKVKPLTKEKPRFVTLIAVADYAEFVSNFGGDPDETITHLVLPDGQSAFCKLFRGYAVVSASEKAVDRYQPGMDREAFAKQIGPEGVNALKRGDLSLVVHSEKLSDQTLDDLTHLVQQLGEQDSAPPVSGRRSDAKFTGHGMDAAKAMYRQSIRSLFGDSRYVSTGIGLSESGLDIQVAFALKPTSHAASWLKIKPAKNQLLAKLTRRDYLLAFSSVLQGARLDLFLDAARTQLKTHGVWTEQLLGAARPLTKQIQGMAGALYAPQGALGLGSHILNAVFLIQTEDGNRFVQTFKDFLKQLDGNQIPMGQLPEDASEDDDPRPRLSLVSQFAPNALSDDRAQQIAQYQLQYNVPIQVLSQMDDAARRILLLGLNNMEGYIAAVGNTVILTTATDVQLLKDTLAMVTSNQGLGQITSIQKTKKRLASTPTGQLYINSVSTMKTVYKITQMLLGKQELDPVFPKSLAPAGMSVTTTDQDVAIQFFFPMKMAAYLHGDAMDILKPWLPKPEKSSDRTEQNTRDGQSDNMDLEPMEDMRGRRGNNRPQRRGIPRNLFE